MPAEGREGNMVESSFSAIEKRIGDLVAMVADLKKEKGVLAEELERRTAEARELAERVAELTRERNEVRARVETILSRLESVEL